MRRCLHRACAKAIAQRRLRVIGIRVKGNRECRAGAGWGGGLQHKLPLRSIKRGEPVAHVGKANALTAARRNVSPLPVSCTVITSADASRRARTHTVPPFAAGSIPCLIAFSTSEISRLGGNGWAASPGATSMVNPSRDPMRVRRILRYASARPTSLPRVVELARSCGNAARRYSMR